MSRTEYRRKWLAEHPGYKKEHNRKWRAANPDYMKQWWAKHGERVNARNRERYVTDPAFRVAATTLRATSRSSRRSPSAVGADATPETIRSWL